MQAAVRQTLRTVLTVNWTQFQGLAALRCAAGVAVPLLVGLAIEQPVVGVFGAVGAIGVGFGSFQGAYRGRAAVMLIASVAMAFSFCIGSLAGHSNAATIGVAAVWGLGGGLLVSVGQGASFVGLQAIVAVVIAGGYPTDLAGALVRTVLVLVGGLGQTFLVVMIWPLRRFPVERRHLAAAYRSLAAYAATLPARQAVPPEPHTFASMPSPLADPQPFVGSDRIFIFQTLLDEAERIRASLASLVVRHLRLQDADQEDRPALAALSAQALTEIAAALEAYAESAPADIERLKGSRAAARLARSNAEAVVDRMLTEPRRSYTMSPLTAVGIVGATHRNALAALSLHAGLELDRRGAVTGVQKLADQAASSMLSLADAVRGSAAPSPLPPLRQTQVALAPAFSDLVNQETDLIVDSIDTIAELLAKDVSL